MKKIGIQQVKKGIMMSVLSQIVSLAVSFLLNLIVPKFIDEYQYAHWQTYMLYIAYVGVLHFGLLDGIVLRYSQYDYDELDKPRLRSQFKLLLAGTSTFAAIGILVSMLIRNQTSGLILILVSLGIVTKNLFTYTSYTFQITNRINKYAMITLAQRSFYGVGVLVLLALGVKDFYWICIFDLCGDLFGMLLGAWFNRGLYFGSSPRLLETLREAKVNVASGVLLLIANWSSVLLLGSAKMIVQWRWDDLVFGKVSFAFSVSNLFLSFVTAISVVLFPTLKRMEKDRLPVLYKSIRDVISPIMFFAMLLYFPGCWILEKWLPAYQPSLVYLGILLPIIIYTSKVSLLTNNYLKAYRKERSMLIVNVISIAVAVLLFVLSAYVFDNLTILLICVVFVIMLRSILSELVVMREIKIRFIADFIIEALMTIGFIVFAMLFDLWVGFALYIILLIIYCIFYRNNLKKMVLQITGKRKGIKS